MLRHRTKTNSSSSLVWPDLSLFWCIFWYWKYKWGQGWRCCILMLFYSVPANRNCGQFTTRWLTGILWFTDYWDCWVLPEFLWTQSLRLQWRQGPPATRTRGQRFAHLIACSFTGDHFENCRLTLRLILVGKEQLEPSWLSSCRSRSQGGREHALNTEAAVDFSLIKLS